MTTSKQIFGLLGYPVKHSLSPAMHNAAFRHLEIDAEYRLFEVQPGELVIFLQSLKAQGISGLNVTVPYKEKVISYVSLDAESAHLTSIKAVNTIVRRGMLWNGYNTDITGFARDIGEQFGPSGKRAVVLGAGGASRAVTYVLAKEGVSELALFDQDAAKTRAVADMLRELFPALNLRAVHSVDDLDIPHADLLVNATPAGLHAGDPCPVSEKLLHKNLFVYDLIYNPAQTVLMRAASAAGARVSNGLGMLLYQGAAAFEYFSGLKAPVEVMRRALEEGVIKLCSSSA